MSLYYFPRKKLGDILSFKNGKSIKPGGIGEYPVYGANGIIGGCNKYQEQNGIILGRVGAYCGSVTYYSGKFWASDNTIVVYPKNDEYDVLFLSYLLREQNLNHWAGGAAQPLLTQTVLKQVESPVPPLSTQHKIAAILSAYDDLIENNLRRIKILEEMAQNLYREWFVKFCFPGHQHARFIDSPHGHIPEGWKTKKLGDIATINWGDTSTTKASYVENGYDAYSASGLDGKLDHYDYDRTGIVLSAIGAQCGKTWLARGKWSCIKNTIRFWSNIECASTEFLFIATKGQDFWPRRGAAQPFISQGDAERIELLIPDLETMIWFTTFTADALEKIDILQAQIQTLRCTRDLLLPKLISGEVDVSQLDITIPEEVA